MPTFRVTRAAAISGLFFWLTTSLWAQDRSVDQALADVESMPVADAVGVRHAVILVGLAGDEEHETQFRAHANAWYTWLRGVGVQQDHVRVLVAQDTAQRAEAKRAVVKYADRDAIKSVFDELQPQLSEEDTLWLFFMGHGDYDGEHARFHIPGSDLRAVDFAELFDKIPCRQQVIWLTMSSSGWFLEPLSRPGRIVITATQAEAEPNETEFPAALAEAMHLPATEVDTDHDQTISVLELFAKTVDLVEQRYQADERAVTEHAMIDDNGDGRGTELKAIREQQRQTQLADETEIIVGQQRRDVDGRLAGTTVLQVIRERPALVSPPKLEP